MQRSRIEIRDSSSDKQNYLCLQIYPSWMWFDHWEHPQWKNQWRDSRAKGVATQWKRLDSIQPRIRGNELAEEDRGTDREEQPVQLCHHGNQRKDAWFVEIQFLIFSFQYYNYFPWMWVFTARIRNTQRMPFPLLLMSLKNLMVWTSINIRPLIVLLKYCGNSYQMLPNRQFTHQMHQEPQGLTV